MPNFEEGFRPTGHRAKAGICTLCGSWATLTKAHVPPRRAFNQRAFRTGGTTTGTVGERRLAYGRTQAGGLNLYAHCQGCRRQTSPLDDEYIWWAYAFAKELQNAPDNGNRVEVAGRLVDVRPGRFVRAALAGMSALTPALIHTHPDLLSAVLDGSPITPPHDLRFLMASTPAAANVHVEGNHGGMAVELSSDGSGFTTKPAISAVVHFPPFSLLLADAQWLEELPHVDCSSWLEYGIEDRVTIDFNFPIVDLPPTPHSPVPASMLKFTRVTA